MKIGLVTDIHNDAASLSLALAALDGLGVELYVTLGDTCDAFGHAHGLAEVAAMLHERNAVGVWGNHDFVLCRDVSVSHVARYAGTRVLDFLAGMNPVLDVGDCRFSHREPLGDPHDVEFLWSLETERLDLFKLASQSFAAVDRRLQFIGHYHQWWAATPEASLDWTGDRPLEFTPGQRYFVIVAPIMSGWCGWLDTDAGVLVPVRVGSATRRASTQ
jgi:Calcineurin-like phosphoesterase superfamily domain